MLVIDGSVLEGGGQVIRMSMALSALMSKPIQISNIRSGRQKPGLKAQHLIGLRLIRDITNGRLTGDEMDSTSVTFKPKAITCGTFFGDTKTAGSVTLLMQTSVPCLLYASDTSCLRLRGGTNAEMAPQIDFTIDVLKPILEKFGISLAINLIRRGFYPKGGGEVEVRVEPIRCLRPIVMTEFGQLTRIFGHSFVAGVLPLKMADAMADAATHLLRKAFPGVDIDIKRSHESAEKALGNGSAVVLIAESSTGCRLCGTALGKRSLAAEEVGRMAANELIEEMGCGATVDRHAVDQIIIFMALASGRSAVRTGPPTQHTETAIHFAELITGAKFEMKSVIESKQFVIECQGIGLINRSIASLQ